MAVCLVTDANGYLVVQEGTDPATCPYVAVTHAEWQGLAGGWTDLLKLTPAQGSEIAVAVMTIWAIGWAFSAIARVLNEVEGDEK